MRFRWGLFSLLFGAGGGGGGGGGLCPFSHSSWELPHPAFSRPPIELSPHHPWIALTFDDGPSPGMTEKLLEVLKGQRGVPGTFFIVGKMGVRFTRGWCREIFRAKAT